MKAAKRMSISPSAVSRQIALLEASCKRRLLNRSSKSVALTQQGKDLLSAIKNFRENLTAHGYYKNTVTLKIGALEGIFQHIVKKQILRAEQNSNWDLYVDIDSPGPLIERLKTGKLDLAFISLANQTELPPDFVLKEILKERIVLISKNKIPPKDIHQFTWICFEPNTWIRRYTQKNPKKIIRVNRMSAIIDFVERGVGIAMIPEHCIPEHAKLFKQGVPKFSKASVYAIYPQKAFRAPHVQAFLESYVFSA